MPADRGTRTPEPAAVADGEIAARRQTIEDNRREVEHNRRLFQSLYS